MSMITHKDGSARIDTSSATYVRRISDIKDALAGAVDKPIAFKYDDARKVSYGDSQRSEKENPSPFLNMKAGAKLAGSESLYLKRPEMIQTSIFWHAEKGDGDSRIIKINRTMLTCVILLLVAIFLIENPTM